MRIDLRLGAGAPTAVAESIIIEIGAEVPAEVEAGGAPGYTPIIALLPTNAATPYVVWTVIAETFDSGLVRTCSEGGYHRGLAEAAEDFRRRDIRARADRLRRARRAADRAALDEAAEAL